MHYHPSNGLEKRPAWNNERGYWQIKELCAKEEFFCSLFEKLENYLLCLPRDPSVYHLIHADIHHGNFLVNEYNSIILFDFDDCHYNWLIYDLAVSLFNLDLAMREQCSRDEIESMHQDFLDGYRETGLLSEEWLSKLDLFILYRNFVIYSWAKKNIHHEDLSLKVKKWMFMMNDLSGQYIRTFNYQTLEKK